MKKKNCEQKNEGEDDEKMGIRNQKERRNLEVDWKIGVELCLNWPMDSNKVVVKKDFLDFDNFQSIQ